MKNFLIKYLFKYHLFRIYIYHPALFLFNFIRYGKLSFKILKTIYKNEVRCPEENTAKKMRASILNAKKKGDSLGGIIESITTNVPVGLGEPIFSSLESDLSKAIFAIPSVKGIEFGS